MFAIGNEIDCYGDNELLDLLSILQENEGESETTELRSISAGHISSSSSDSVSSSLVVSKKPKRKSYRKPSRNPMFMPSLRIVKSDIRRRYGEMWCNVMNYHEPDLVARFFTEFSIPNVAMRHAEPEQLDKESYRLFMEELQKHQEKPKNVFGVSNVVQLFCIGFSSSPDFVMQMNRTQVKVTEGESGSVVISEVAIRGTQTREMVFEDSLGPNGEGGEICCFPGDRKAIWKDLRIPNEFRYNGQSILYLDNLNRIISFGFKITFFRRNQVPGLLGLYSKEGKTK